jgi:hypothetical protein
LNSTEVLQLLPPIAVVIAALIAIYGVWYGKKKEKEVEQIRMRPVPDAVEHFLSKGETLMSYDPESADFRNSLSSARSSAKMITLTGAAWLLNPQVRDSIKKAVKKGVNVSLLLQDPYCKEAEEERNLEFSISAVPDPGVPKRPSEYLAENVKSTLAVYLAILGEDRIRVLDDVIVVKGTVFDSKIAQIISYAVPKRGSPMRMIVNNETVLYIEKYYFDRQFERAVPIQQKLKEWKKVKSEDWKDFNISDKSSRQS